MELRKGAVRRTCSSLHNHDDEANEGFSRQSEISVKIRKLKKKLKEEMKRVVVIKEEPTTPGEDEENSDVPLPKMKIAMESADGNANLLATVSLRKVMCKEADPPIDWIITEGFVDQLILFLKRDNFRLQYESAWILVNITAGTSKHTRHVVKVGAARQLICLLSSEAKCLVELCVWALGNIAGDGADMRDDLVENGILKPLLTIVDMKSPANFLRTIAWTISNLCRNKFPSRKMTVLKVLLAPLICLIQHTDVGILSHACWALSHITEGSINHVDEVVKCRDLMKRLVVLLGSTKVGILTPALRTICNIVSHSDSYIKAMIDFNVFNYIPELLNHRRRHIMKDACSIVERMSAVSSRHIQTAIGCNLIPPLIDVLKTGDTKSKMVATQAIKYLALLGTLDQVDCLINEGVFKPLCALLSTKNERFLLLILDAIRVILEAASMMGVHDPLVSIMYKTRTMFILEALQYHENKAIFKKALGIAEDFCADYEVEDQVDQDLAPENSVYTEFRTGDDNDE